MIAHYCCCSVTKSCLTLCGLMDCSTPGSSVLHYLPEFAQSHVHWVSDAIHTSHPLSPPCHPALHLSRHLNLFQWVNSSHQVTKVLELQFSFSRSSEYSELISFRMDWFHLLTVQGTLRSLLQHQSLKASVLWHSAFFMAQVSHPYMTTGKTMVWHEEALVTQSCLPLCTSMNCSLPGSSVHGVLQTTTLEWVAIAFSRGSSWSRYWT